MTNSARPVLFAAMLLATATAASAADIIEAPIYEAPPPVVYEPVDTGGWYIRGDVDYHWSKFRGGDFITYGVGVPTPGTNRFTSGELKGSWSLGAGVGYQVSRHFRTDLTIDYFAKSKFSGSTAGTCGGVPCFSTDSSSYSAWLLLANAYAELGTYHGVTPYIGAGIGGAHVKWDSLRNTIGGVTDVHAGAKGWRFAYALMAGASYCLTKNLHLDVGYRFSRINGGRMFEYVAPAGGGVGAGPGFDKGIDVHEVRGGLRYQFGGGKAECGPQEVAYQPDPIDPPIYK